MEVLVVGPRPERRRLVDAAQEVAEAGGFHGALDAAAVSVRLQLGAGGVQELIDVHASSSGSSRAAANGRVERDQAAAAGTRGVVVLVLVRRRRRVHGAVGRRRARDVEVDLGAVLAAVAAGRLRLLVEVDQLRRPFLPAALQRQYLRYRQESISCWLLLVYKDVHVSITQPQCSNVIRER